MCCFDLYCFFTLLFIYNIRSKKIRSIFLFKNTLTQFHDETLILCCTMYSSSKKNLTNVCNHADKPYQPTVLPKFIIFRKIETILLKNHILEYIFSCVSALVHKFILVLSTDSSHFSYIPLG